MPRGPRNETTSSLIRCQSGASRLVNSASTPTTVLANNVTNQVPYFMGVLSWGIAGMNISACSDGRTPFSPTPLRSAKPPAPTPPNHAHQRDGTPLALRERVFLCVVHENVRRMTIVDGELIVECEYEDCLVSLRLTVVPMISVLWSGLRTS